MTAPLSNQNTQDAYRAFRMRIAKALRTYTQKLIRIQSGSDEKQSQTLKEKIQNAP